MWGPQHDLVPSDYSLPPVWYLASQRGKPVRGQFTKNVQVTIHAPEFRLFSLPGSGGVLLAPGIVLFHMGEKKTSMYMYVGGGVYKPNREENGDVTNPIDSFSSETTIISDII